LIPSLTLFPKGRPPRRLRGGEGPPDHHRPRRAPRPRPPVATISPRPSSAPWPGPPPRPRSPSAATPVAARPAPRSSPRRPHLAGHAPEPQPQLGPARHGGVRAGPEPLRRHPARLAGPLHRRHEPAPRRPHDERSRESPDPALDVDVWMLPPAASTSAVRSARRSPPPTCSGRTAPMSTTPGRRSTRRSCAGASDPRVARIFIFAGPKVEMCENATATAPGCARSGRGGGTTPHFHVRLHCPPGAQDCAAQDPVPPATAATEARQWQGQHPEPAAGRPERPRGRAPARPLLCGSAGPVQGPCWRATEPLGLSAFPGRPR
jgi:penicillin-insensitive murein endopeptidase